MAFIAVIIPSLLTPGNTLKLQLSLLQINEVILIIIFSSLFGISIAMQIYASHKEKKQGEYLVKGTGTGLVAFTGTLFSAKLCPICLGAILGFIGIGGSATLFLFSYKNEIMITSIFVLVFTIYLAGNRIAKVKVCEKCNS
ncbi:hypothetical protein HYT23_02725 [Candidatus Pacearchaeota archaeon]|nr:hypothetical protein [Candidatus Pacearchaeota archaeon]